MTTSKRDGWAEQIRLWKASGLTANEFSAKTGINAHTLKNWQWRLSKNSGNELRDEGDRHFSSGGFVELVSPRKAASVQKIVWKELSGEKESFEVILRSGRRILVPNRFDATCLRRIVDALEGW